MAHQALKRAETLSEGGDEASARAPKRFAHVVSVSGSQAIAVLEQSAEQLNINENRIEIGALVKIPTPWSDVTGLISAVSMPMPTGGGADAQIGLVEINLSGEIVSEAESGRSHFRHGVANPPSLGDPVLFATRDDLQCVYAQPDSPSIEVGVLYQDSSVPARLLFDDLLSKHFCIVGTTGCGKSSALTCILQRIVGGYKHARVVVLDIHGEYRFAFADKAELIDMANLHIPFWLLNFQELASGLVRTEVGHEAEIEILGEAVLAAKRRYAETTSGRLVALKHKPEVAMLTLDSPTPFRLSDIVSYLDDQMGKLDRAQLTLPYRRLKQRIEALVSDQRYSFMFANLTADTMAETLGRIFRVPDEGKPITVIDLASVPPEILDVVISVVSRIAFDLAMWSQGTLPTLIACEEAHRYAPARDGEKFQPTRDALSRIAKEGRKYGLSLGLVTQRPSELDPTILSQCSTMISMRLSTERDQNVIRANSLDGAFNLLDFLPLLADREAIVIGQGVAMPMRIRFNDIGSMRTQNNLHTRFSDSWQNLTIDHDGLEQIVDRWRLSGRKRV